MFQNMKVGVMLCVLLVYSSVTFADNTYDVYTPVKKTLSAKDIVQVKNGELKFKGKTIFDEDGNIVAAYNINNQLFYFVRKDSSDKAGFILKNEKGKEIKKFEGALLQIVDSEDGLPLILVQLNSMISKFDNVYIFDGKEVKLIRKNIQQYVGECYKAGMQIVPGFINGTFANQYSKIESIATGETKKIGTLHPKDYFFGGPKKEKMEIVAVVGQNIIYRYKASDDKVVLEAYNVKTGSQTTLVRGEGVFQFLTAGKKVILNIFKDKSLSEKDTLEHLSDSYLHDYSGKESTYIDLSTLEEVTIDPKEFHPYMLRWAYKGDVNGWKHKMNYFELDGKIDTVLMQANGCGIF